MSTLPFLLSVADELDNLNSQSYMDDFGLGFHPHRQYYRTPTIQLSLPASTDWMQQERQQRFRSHKFYEQNNLHSTGEEDDDAEDATRCEDEDKASGNAYSADTIDRFASEPSTSIASRQKYSTSALNSNITTASHAGPSRPSRPSQAANMGKMTTNATKGNTTNTNTNTNASRSTASRRFNRDDYDEDDDDDDNIDNSVRMYNLSKKCCKNYHRHAIETNAKGAAGSSCQQAGQNSSASSSTATGAAATGSYRLHSKCMEGNNSSSEESLQKASSSIEFLTCFLLKRSRASSSSSSSRNAAGGGSKKS